MLFRLFRFLAQLFKPKLPLFLQMPVFYAVIESPGHHNVVHETSRSIHRVRGICRELKAQGKNVAIATYTAELVTKEF